MCCQVSGKVCDAAFCKTQLRSTCFVSQHGSNASGAERRCGRLGVARPKHGCGTYLIIVGLSSERPPAITCTSSGRPIGRSISGLNMPEFPISVQEFKSGWKPKIYRRSSTAWGEGVLNRALPRGHNSAKHKNTPPSMAPCTDCMLV